MEIAAPKSSWGCVKSPLDRAAQMQGEGKGMDGRATDKAKKKRNKYSLCSPPRTTWPLASTGWSSVKHVMLI